jgi:Ribonuclease G/E
MNLFTKYTNFILLLASLIGGYIAVDSHYAKAAALRTIELRVDQKILSDRYDRIQERIWKYEDRYKSPALAVIEVSKEWRILIQEKQDLERQLDLIRQQSIQQGK